MENRQVNLWLVYFLFFIYMETFELYYNKKQKKWKNLSSFKELDSTLINDLQHARKNNKFLIVRNNRYPGISAKLLYYPIHLLKLFLNNTVYLSTESHRAIIKNSDIVNFSKIKSICKENLEYVLEYVDDVSYLTEEEKSNGLAIRIKKQSYETLSNEGKLYYQLFGESNLDNN